MKYHVLVVAEGKHFGVSTARLYVHLRGELKETGVIEIPNGGYETEFEVSVYSHISTLSTLLSCISQLIGASVNSGDMGLLTSITSSAVPLMS